MPVSENHNRRADESPNGLLCAFLPRGCLFQVMYIVYIVSYLSARFLQGQQNTLNLKRSRALEGMLKHFCWTLIFSIALKCIYHLWGFFIFKIYLSF